jgi:hypothetical protein
LLLRPDLNEPIMLHSREGVVSNSRTRHARDLSS